MFETLFE